MDPRKIDQIAEEVGDLSNAADELKDELGDTPHESLNELREGLERASDQLDDLADGEDD